MYYRLASAFVLCLVGFGTTAKADMLSGLGVAGDYNLFAFGNVSRTNADTEGRLAVGGTATLTNFGVNDKMTGDGPAVAALVVGGNLDYTNGNVFHGSGFVGGTATTSGLGFANGGSLSANLGTGGLPIDFVAAQADLTAKSSFYSTLAANGTATNNFGQLNLVGTDANLNVFDLAGSDLAGLNGFNLTAPTGSTVLVNVSGNPGAFTNYGMSLNGVGNSDVLFNFADATNLNLSGFDFRGSILAPGATLNFTNGQINGTTVVNEVAAGSSGEFHVPGFGGELPPNQQPNAVPAPPAAVLGLIAFAGLAIYRRRFS